MKFTVNKKMPDSGKDLVFIRFVKGETVRFVERDGKLEMILGIGEAGKITRRKFFTLARKIVQAAKQNKIKRVAIKFDDLLFPKLKDVEKEELASLLAQNMEMANFEFTKFKERPKEGWNEVKEVILCGGIDHAVIERGVERGKLIGEEVNNCRTLSNTPGGDMTPKMLAEAAKKASLGTDISVKVLGRREMEKLKMGAILGVAKGSSEEPKFIIMEYLPLLRRGRRLSQISRGLTQKEKHNNQPLVLVGKGVTFDTGGLNLKPTEGIAEMHMDMSGGAAVIHSLALIAKLKIRKNVIGLIPAVENMPSGSSYRPGDILRSMSGKTIEVLNTDAEGRVILADALTYAKRYNPSLVIDVATLTGAVLTALGQHASAILTKDKKLEKLLEDIGEEVGDYVWPFPLWDEYEEYVKGNVGDVANIPASGNTRHAGVISGAMFLYQFVKDPSKSSGEAYPWVHIDMASRMTTAPSDNLAKGASGDPVRLLAKLIEKY